MAITSKEGDKVTQENGETVIITPPSAEHNYNFGPVSLRDTLVYTCERPGGDPNLHNDGHEASTKIAPKQAVEGWMKFMTHPDRQIQHVIILLSKNELEEGYEEPGLLAAYQEKLDEMKSEYKFQFHHIHFTPSSHDETMAKLDSITKLNEKVVVHCTHGMGRSGRVAAAWLVHQYGLSGEDATEEVLDIARQHHVQRMGAVNKLTDWIQYQGAETKCSIM